jgi:di/tricarboxylate transporter
MNDAFLIKLRGFGLAALYISLAMLALLLTLVAFKLWPYADGILHHSLVMGTASISIISAMSQSRAAHRIINALNKNLAMPPLEFIPFMLMALCLILSSWLLLGIEGF